MLEEVSAGMFVWSTQSQRRAWSPKLLQVLGYTASDPRLDDVQGLLHPEDAARHKQVVDDALRDKRGYTVDVRVRQAQGAYRNMTVLATWLAEDETRADRFIGFLLDRTEAEEERAQNDRRVALFRAFFENAPAGAYIKARSGRYLYGNAMAAEMAGVSMEDYLTKPAQQLFEPDVARSLAEVDERVLETGETATWRGQLTARSGRDQSVLNIKFPVRDPLSNELMLGGFAVDVTYQQQMEQALAEAQKLDALGQLVAGIAHDFNNTLAVLQGNLDLLEMSDAPDHRAQCMAELHSAVDRGARLTRQLLAYGRKAVLRQEVEDLNRLLDGLSSMLKRILPETIAVETDFASTLWPVRIDRAQVESAVLNLVLNARDAMPRGGTLSIKTENVTLAQDDPDARNLALRPGDYVVLEVGDTGKGMEPEIALRAFDPFFTTKPVDQGSGMGLAMVYGLMKQFGGLAKLTSTPGAGTCVRLYFPAERAAVAAGAQPQPKARQGSEHILLVEDEDAVRVTLQRQLTNLGYRVTEAASGDEGLARLRLDGSIALLVTDIVMPGSLQGPDLAEKAKTLRPDMPVLFISGYPLEPAIATCGLPPGEVNLSKPIALADLSQAIRAKLD